METNEKKVVGWHFLPADGKLAYDDGRIVEVGQTLSVNVAPDMCHAGLHASEDIMDALSFRRGPILCRVEVSGDVQVGQDKVCGKRRKCLAMADISRELRIFAIESAEHVVEVFEKRYPNDKRPRDCIAVARKYLDGKATLDDLRRARAAAAYAAADAAAAYAAYAAAAAAADAAYAAYAAAYAAADAAAAYAAYAAYAAAADAAYAAYAAYAAAADADAADARTKERNWQRNTLLSLLPAELTTV